MKIHLYNLYHIGDLFFNQSTVKNICQSNAKHQITMYCLYNFEIFRDIPNLKVEHVQSHPQWEILQQNHPFTRLDHETLAINLHICAVSLVSGYQLDQLELKLYNFQCALQNMFCHINDLFKTDLVLTSLSKNELIPILPEVSINAFLSWYADKNDKQLVFYYNYLPKSGQTISFTNHNSIIIHLATTFPDTYILLPTIDSQLQYMIDTKCLTKIINCKEQFECYETESCKNIIQLTKISEYCNYSIHFDTGACFYYINTNTYHSKNTILHVAINTYYYNKLISNYTDDDTIIINNKIKFIEANDNNLDQLIYALT